ncbi:thymidine kinase 2, mitochondrial-like [Asterias rubens]|uniref:thymidine kinase 2, mitochondrial-like n=1 Tax=Asterias rubens TaxID=7604 RepID=UPI00145535A9|nr:thymidine kinase 2, mitochondrial-like [Asterias rubens]
MPNLNQENLGVASHRRHVTNVRLTTVNNQSRTGKPDENKAAHRAVGPHEQSRPALVDISSVHSNNAIENINLTQQRPKTIVIEGNIGSGKSTLLKYFGQKDDIEVFPEPVHKWRDNKGQNMLDLLYQDPSRWSFAFQSYVQFTMLQVHQAQPRPTSRVKMMERSIHSGKYCFIENLYKSNKLQTPEYNVLSEWFDWLLTTKDLHVDHIVYLRSTPEQCQRRICERSRKEESGIPLEYLRELHEMHEDWLIRKTKFQLPAPVLVLDASKSLAEMEHQFKYLEDKLELNV